MLLRSRSHPPVRLELRSALTSREAGCLKNCAVKNAQHMQRIGLRVSEIQNGAQD